MWKGTLTYLDYTSGKPYSMPANVEVRLIENSNSFILNDTYPDEPQANSSDTLQISADGRMVDNETVQLNRLLKNGEREIITQTKGIDGNQRKPATIQHIYTIGKVHFSIKKLVKFDTDTAFFLRHEYAYTR